MSSWGTGRKRRTRQPRDREAAGAEGDHPYGDVPAAGGLDEFLELGRMISWAPNHSRSAASWITNVHDGGYPGRGCRGASCGARAVGEVRGIGQTGTSRTGPHGRTARSATGRAHASRRTRADPSRGTPVRRGRLTACRDGPRYPSHHPRVRSSVMRKRIHVAGVRAVVDGGERAHPLLAHSEAGQLHVRDVRAVHAEAVAASWMASPDCSRIRRSSVPRRSCRSVGDVLGWHGRQSCLRHTIGSTCTINSANQ